MLYMLALSMVSLPTSLTRHLLVETAGNQGGDDYHRSPPRLPPSGGSDYRRPKKNSKKAWNAWQQRALKALGQKRGLCNTGRTIRGEYSRHEQNDKDQFLIRIFYLFCFSYSIIFSIKIPHVSTHVSLVHQLLSLDAAVGRRGGGGRLMVWSLMPRGRYMSTCRLNKVSLSQHFSPLKNRTNLVEVVQTGQHKYSM